LRMRQKIGPTDLNVGSLAKKKSHHNLRFDAVV